MTNMQAVLPKADLPFCLLTFALVFAASSAFSEYRVIELDPQKTGEIRGIVRFPGETPPPMMFANASDPVCPRGIPQTHLLVRQESRGIQNALVTLQIPRGKPFQKQTAEIRFESCRLEPRVQWAPPATPIYLVNKDPTDHRIHSALSNVTVFNVLLESGEPAVRRALARRGLYRVNCDHHLWERAWIYVPENPYTALTDERGEFRMTHVPPGTYAIRAWHEGWERSGKDRDGRPEAQPVAQTLFIRVDTEEITQVQFERLRPTF